MFRPKISFALSLGLCLLAGLAFGESAQAPKPKAKGVNDALPRPDGRPADVSKTVKAFILMGQQSDLTVSEHSFDHGDKLYRDCRFFNLVANRDEAKPLKVADATGLAATAAKKL